jgi:hypothetical protein
MGARSTAVPVTEKLFEYRMSVEEFGTELLRTKDLDPVYVILYKADMIRSHLACWLLAYWWFYHSGVASALALQGDGKDFYNAARAMAGNSAPRGTERRHFRGIACLDCIDWFSRRYEHPVELLKELEKARTFRRIKKIVTCFPMFGPWIAFKIADMMERVWGASIQFDGKDLLSFYEEPREAARVVGSLNGMDNELDVLPYLEMRFQPFAAPPGEDRPVGIQEIETILCKWKAHIHGNYPIGKDTKEVRHHLLQFPSTIGDRLLEFLP